MKSKAELETLRKKARIGKEERDKFVIGKGEELFRIATNKLELFDPDTTEIFESQKKHWKSILDDARNRASDIVSGIAGLGVKSRVACFFASAASTSRSFSYTKEQAAKRWIKEVTGPLTIIHAHAMKYESDFQRHTSFGIGVLLFLMFGHVEDIPADLEAMCPYTSGSNNFMLTLLETNTCLCLCYASYLVAAAEEFKMKSIHFCAEPGHVFPAVFSLEGERLLGFEAGFEGNNWLELLVDDDIRKDLDDVIHPFSNKLKFDTFASSECTVRSNASELYVVLTHITTKPYTSNDDTLILLIVAGIIFFPDAVKSMSNFMHKQLLVEDLHDEGSLEEMENSEIQFTEALESLKLDEDLDLILDWIRNAVGAFWLSSKQHPATFKQVDQSDMINMIEAPFYGQSFFLFDEDGPDAEELRRWTGPKGIPIHYESLLISRNPQSLGVPSTIQDAKTLKNFIDKKVMPQLENTSFNQVFYPKHIWAGLDDKKEMLSLLRKTQFEPSAPWSK